MSIVKFYRGDPNAPKPTMGAHLGSNAIITCKGRLLLEKRRDSDVWGLVGGGVKNYETELQAMQREVKEELGIRVQWGEFLAFFLPITALCIAVSFTGIILDCIITVVGGLAFLYLNRQMILDLLNKLRKKA